MKKQFKQNIGNFLALLFSYHRTAMKIKIKIQNESKEIKCLQATC